MLIAFACGSGARADALSEILAPEAAAEAGEEGGTIEAESSPTADAEIARRLRGIYAELDAIDGVTVEVASGIVTLGGTADGARGAERAVGIASQVVGVVEVVDDIEVDTNVARRLRATLDRLLAGAITTFAALPVLLLAVAIVGLFWWIARWVSRRRGLFSALAPNGFIADLLGGIARIVVVALGAFLALSLLDATSIIGTVLGAAGIVGLAVGFAVRDTVENWIASVLLSLRTPFLARDYVAIGEHEGAVARLTSRATILISLDGNHIRIPNATVYKSVVVNYTRNPDRRFEFTVGVDAEHDLGDAQRTALEAVHEVPGVRDAPGATVIVEDLGDSSVTLTVMAWIDQRTSDVRKVRSEAIRFVKQAFDAAGIVMPEPIYRINVGTPGSALERAAHAVADPDSPVDATVSTSDDVDDGASDGAEDGSAPGSRPADESGAAAQGGRAERPGPAARRGEARGRPAGGAGANAGAGARRLTASDAADTSLDVAVESTLEREIDSGRRGGAENLLDGDAPRE